MRGNPPAGPTSGDGGVYPRVCGGTALKSGVHPARNGLSPRMRGNRRKATHGQMPNGSIPAYAGEPRRRRPHSLDERVYPRVCGGTGSLAGSEVPVLGLSPRMRGNRNDQGPFRTCYGSIPAYAGEPWHWRPRPRRWRVYPRVCGGTGGGLTDDVARHGLSPRMRGNHSGGQSSRSCLRSIPAYAGEPLLEGMEGRARWVYPRVCGGTDTGRIYAGHGNGLSPRMRGNRTGAGKGGIGRGSIPAYAGEPRDLFLPLPLEPVYPRVCGGTYPSIWGTGAPLGLSPRMRGNRSRDDVGRAVSRSIPAYAGEPSRPVSMSIWTGVYPRVCGGTACRPPEQPVSAGLSPRMRGNQVWRLDEDQHDRSIPAYAGEPG